MRDISKIQLTNGEIFNIKDSNSLHKYNSFEDLKKNIDNLVIGSVIKTLGYYSINDGGSATYKITNVKSETEYQEVLGNNMFATIITNNQINIKQIGCKSDGSIDSTEKIQKALNLYKTIYFSTGTFLINNTLKMNEYNVIIGNSNSIIKTTQTTKPLIYVNRYCRVSNLKFELIKGFNSNVFEISFKTLSPQKIFNKYNDTNIQINNIDFLYDLDINDLTNKKGNCFLISADNTESEIIYNGSGFYGIYITDIFVKGSCFSVIKQYVLKDLWVTGCFYNNFNIDSAPLYGFYGYKNNEIGTDTINYNDGNMIYFSNWQMQCGNSKNMFAFSYGGKYLSNCLPWDWKYSVSGEKPYSILYRTDIKELIDLGGLQLNIYDLVDLINKPNEINYYDFIDNNFHKNDNLNTSIYNTPSTKLFTISNTAPISITGNSKWNKLNLGKIINKDNHFQIKNNGIEVISNISILNLILNLDYYSVNDGDIAIFKNDVLIRQTSFIKGYNKINISQVIKCKKDDVFDVRIYTSDVFRLDIQSDDFNNFSALAN